MGRKQKKRVEKLKRRQKAHDDFMASDKTVPAGSYTRPGSVRK